MELFHILVFENFPLSHSNTKPMTGRKMSVQKTTPAFPGAKLWAVIIW
jgi:hypothetical protein